MRLVSIFDRREALFTLLLCLVMVFGLLGAAVAVAIVLVLGMAWVLL